MHITNIKNKERKKKMSNTVKLLETEFYNGATFYFEQNVDRHTSTCVDIDIKPFVTTIKFSSRSLIPTYFQLRNVHKQFPNITKIIIGYNVRSIDISNFMFPNVVEVQDLSGKFCLSADMLVTSDGVLLNTFCKPESSKLNLLSINEISSFAMEGCRTTKISNFGRIIRCRCDAFTGSAFETIYGKLIGLYVTENKELFPLLYGSDEVIIPDDLWNIISTFEFSSVRKMSVYNFMLFNYNLIPKFEYPQKIVFMSPIPECYSVRTLQDVLCSQNLNCVEICQEDERFGSFDGVVYAKHNNQNEIISCPKMKLGELVIPDNISYIANEAFEDSHLRSVVMSDTITAMGERSFSNSHIKHISLSKNLTRLSNYRGHAFIRTALTDIDIPEHIVSIHNSEFFSCKDLQRVTLHEGLERIMTDAFNYCSSLHEIALPNSLLQIGDESLSYIRCVHIKDRIPAYFLDGINFHYEISEIDIATCKLSAYTKVIIQKGSRLLSEIGDEQDFVFYVPKRLKGKNLKLMSRLLHKYSSMDSTPITKEDAHILKHLYTKCSDTIIKQETALAIYQNDKASSDEVELYLRRSGKQILTRYLKYGRNEQFTQFLEYGFLSRNALKNLYNISVQSDRPELAAYIMQKIDSTGGKETFRL